MKLSYFIQPVHPLNRNYREILNEDIDSVILADRLGYEEAFIGEHFTDLAEPITSSLMFLARLAPVTNQIKLGSGSNEFTSLSSGYDCWACCNDG